jgi:adenylate cyclase class IV
MQESKFRYPTEKAEAVLNRIGAELKEASVQDDIYLISDEKDIYRLVRKDELISLVHFVKEESGFRVAFSQNIQSSEQNSFARLFDDNSSVLTKNRKQYNWKGSEIATDAIAALGEFIEVYPNSDEVKSAIFKEFGLTDTDAIKKSYYDLWQEKSQ